MVHLGLLLGTVMISDRVYFRGYVAPGGVKSREISHHYQPSQPVLAKIPESSSLPLSRVDIAVAMRANSSSNNIEHESEISPSFLHGKSDTG